MSAHIDDLPVEMMEYILGFLMTNSCLEWNDFKLSQLIVIQLALLSQIALRLLKAIALKMLL